MLEQEISFPVAPRKRQYTPEQRAAMVRARKKRKAERMRNQCIFLGLCAVVLVLLVVGVGKLVVLAASAIKAVELPALPDLPDVTIGSVIPTAQAETITYGAVSYDVSEYVYDAADERLILVNTNLPLDENYSVALAVADDATGAQLETEAAESYRAMASAAYADGITLVLSAGYADAAAQQEMFDTWQQYYMGVGYDAEEAYTLAASIVGESCANEHATGYGADILSSDYTAEDLGFADTAAFAWLERYAAEYGFILRYPEEKQMITGRAYQPWHWRYVGVENAKAIVESGYSLEEFVELQGTIS